jgi:hypothetical protein
VLGAYYHQREATPHGPAKVARRLLPVARWHRIGIDPRGVFAAIAATMSDPTAGDQSTLARS